MDTASHSGLLDGLQVKDGKYVGAGSLTRRLGNFAKVLRLCTREELYRFMASQWRTPGDLLEGVQEPVTAFTDPARKLKLPHLLQTMEYIDMGSYLPDDILVKVDRAAMA